MRVCASRHSPAPLSAVIVYQNWIVPLQICCDWLYFGNKVSSITVLLKRKSTNNTSFAAEFLLLTCSLLYWVTKDSTIHTSRRISICKFDKFIKVVTENYLCVCGCQSSYKRLIYKVRCNGSGAREDCVETCFVNIFEIIAYQKLKNYCSKLGYR